MPYDPAEDSRRTQAMLQRQQQDQQAYEAMQRQQREAWVRQPRAAYTVQRAARRRQRQPPPVAPRRPDADRSPIAGHTPTYAPAKPSRSRGWVVLLSILAIVALVIAVALAWRNGMITPSGLSATVVEDVNVREGPSTEFDILDQLTAGQEVVVRCASGGWSQLASPNDGAYVYGDFLRHASTPPAC